MRALPESAPPFRMAAIDLSQLAGNVRRWAELNPDTPLVVDVGADAWGHGLAVVVPALVKLGTQAFVVARLDEAETVRALAPDTLIVTTQHTTDESFERAAELDVAPAVRSLDELTRSLTAGVRGVVLVEDDGHGLPALDRESLQQATAQAKRHGVPVLPPVARAAGAELFGVSENDADTSVQFAPVLRLWAPVLATKRVGPNEGVSYGYTYRTSGHTTLALVPLGYADGISRGAGNRVTASVTGTSYTMAGRVAMDAFMLDLGEVSAPLIGTEVTVLGDATRGEPTVFQHAAALHTHSAEITTRLSARPRRHVAGDAS